MELTISWNALALEQLQEIPAPQRSGFQQRTRAWITAHANGWVLHANHTNHDATTGKTANVQVVQHTANPDHMRVNVIRLT